MHGEPGGNTAHGLLDLVEHRSGHRGDDGRGSLRLHPGRRDGAGGEILGLLHGPLKQGSVFLDAGLSLLQREVAGVDQSLQVDLACRVALFDGLVHDRLGERRLVAFVVPVAAVAEHVDDHVLVELLSKSKGQPGHPNDRFRIVAVDVQDRCLDRLGDVGGVEAGAGLFGAGREPQLVVHHHVHRAPGLVSGQLGQVEGLGHHSLAGEGGITVDEQREHQIAGPLSPPVLFGSHHALQHWVDGLEVAGVGGHLDRDAVAFRRDVRPLGPQVILDVPRAVGEERSGLAFELAEDMGIALANDVGEDVEPAPVSHSDRDLLHAFVGGCIEDGVEEWNQAFGPLEAETLLAEVLGVEEGLQHLGLGQPLQDPALVGVADEIGSALDVPLYPGFLIGLLDVHVLDPHRPAVGIAQQPEQSADGHRLVAADAAGGVFPIEVPYRDPVGERIELGVDGRPLHPQRVEVGDEMTPHPVHVDQLEDPGLLLGPGPAPRRRVLVDRPPGRDVGDPHRSEDLVVEAVLPQQQLGDPAQEQPAFGTLDDAMVVGAGEGDHPADPAHGQRAGIGAFPLRRILDGPDTDDDSLVGHQTGHRLHRAHRSRVGDGGGRAGEIVWGGGPGPEAGDGLLVGMPEGAEVHAFGLLDVGNEQGPRAVGSGHVHCQAQVDVPKAHQLGLFVDLAVGHVHRRPFDEGPHHGPTDEVGEADLAPQVESVELVVDHLAVDLEQLGGERPHRRGGGYVPTRLHPLGDESPRAA